MTGDRFDRTVVTQEPTVAGQETVRTDTHHTTRTGPGGSELARRILVLLFGLIQIVIGLRIILLLLNARTGNDLVAAILNISQVFVAPFEGILSSDAIHRSGATLDLAAIVAFVGWTVLELIVLWAIGIFRREPA
jgi:YGGT family